MDFIRTLFNSDEFSSPFEDEGWTTGLIWLHVLSAVGIWAAYITALVALNYYILRRQNTRVPRAFWIFEGFLVSAGTLNLLEAIVIWWPVYRFHGVLRLLTAILSWAAVVSLIPIIPRILALRRPEELAKEVAERMKAEETLRQSEQRFRTMAETMPTMVAIFQGTGHIYVNPATETMLGYSRKELLHRSFLDYVHPDFREMVLARSRARQRGEAVASRYEVRLVTKDGRDLWADFSAAVVEHEGKPAVLGIALDVTQRTEMEAALRRAMEAAESASRAKSTFLANMSHEIRTPMNAVLGMTDLALDTELTRDQRQYLETARDSAESLLAIINDILDFSKIEAGKLDLEVALFDLRENVEDTMRSLAVRAHGQGLELACRIDRSVPEFVLGDRTRLRQILVNLVGNAVKFTPRGEVVVDVHATGAVDGHVTLHFRVTDTGIGIPADKIDSIFHAFEQGDASTTRRYGGTGLGLAIASRLVQLMEGSIWAESRVEQGSTFHFTADFPLPEPGAVPPTAEPAQVDGTKALIVDDNATNRRILDEILRNWGVSTASAAGAEEALALLREAARQGEPFQIVLSDVNMPDIDGFDLCERCRLEENIRETPFVMLTSATRSSDVARCASLKIAAHLVKPVKQSELYDSIARVLGMRVRPLATGKQTPVTAAMHPMRILLAEDSVANQRLAIGLLTKWGHQIVLASNGREAVEKATSDDRFDLVLMDVQMPELDGFEATRAIRELESAAGRPHVPIIAMTAHAMKGDRERCLEAGMDGYASKPIRPVELSHAIAQFARKSEEAVPESEPATPAAKDATSKLQKHVNWSVALENVADDPELLRSVAAAALEEWSLFRGQLADAAEQGDRPTVRRLAHTLKNAFRTLGAERAYELAERVETAARESGATTYPLAELFEALETISEELTTFITTPQRV